MSGGRFKEERPLSPHNHADIDLTLDPHPAPPYEDIYSNNQSDTDSNEKFFESPIHGRMDHPIHGRMVEPIHGRMNHPIHGRMDNPIHRRNEHPIQGWMEPPIHRVTEQPIRGRNKWLIHGRVDRPFNGRMEEMIHGRLEQKPRGSSRRSAVQYYYYPQDQIYQPEGPGTMNVNMSSFEELVVYYIAHDRYRRVANARTSRHSCSSYSLSPYRYSLYWLSHSLIGVARVFGTRGADFRQDVGTGVCRRSAWLLQQSTVRCQRRTPATSAVSRTRQHGSSLVLGNTITSR